MKKKMITGELLNEMIVDPQNELTRAEFCEMLVQLYDSFDKNDEPAIKYSASNAKNFKDIGHLSPRTQQAILKANAVQIVNGTSDTTFEPDVVVTREMLATMLRNTYYAMYGYGIEMSRGEWRTNFADLIDMSNWAVDSIRFANALDILNGDGVNFMPKSKATHEMGLILLDKANDRFMSFNTEVEFKIKAHNEISSYTDLNLECYYNGLLVGDIKNTHVNWSSSNPSVGKISDEKGLSALGKGSIEVTASYGNISVSELFKVNKTIVTSDEFQPVEVNMKEASLVESPKLTNENQMEIKYYTLISALDDNESTNFRKYILDYENNLAKKSSSFLGNYIYGSNLDKENIYKKLLIEYIEYINTERLAENEQNEELIAAQKLVGRVNDLLVDINKDLGNEINNLGGILGELELKKKVLNITLDQAALNPNMYIGDIGQKISDLYDEIDVVELDIKKIKYDYDFDALKNAHLNMKMDIDVLGTSMLVLDIGMRGYDTYKDYARLKANATTINENLVFLSAIAEGADDVHLRNAAKDILDSALDEFKNGLNALGQQVKNGFAVGGEALIDKGFELIPVVGIWINVGRTIVNITTPIEEQAKMVTELWALDNILDVYSSEFYAALNGASHKELIGNGICILDSQSAAITEKYYIAMMDMTVFGEMKMKKFMNLSNDFLDSISMLIGSDGKRKVGNACDGNINVLREYKDAYLNNFQ